MVKTKQQELITAMKRNTDNQFFVNLTSYIKLRIELQKNSIINVVDMDEMKRIQGRVLEMQDFLAALTRKQVKASTSTGAFN